MNDIDPSDWFSEDAVALRDFLTSPTGRKFIAHLIERRPSFGMITNEVTRLVESGRLEGFEICVKSIWELSAPVKPETKSESYPSLDAPDDVWDPILKATKQDKE